MSLPIHERTGKGSSLIAFPSDYTLLDVETTGYVPRYDNIIEILPESVFYDLILDR